MERVAAGLQPLLPLLAAAVVVGSASSSGAWGSFSPHPKPLGCHPQVLIVIYLETSMNFPRFELG